MSDPLRARLEDASVPDVDGARDRSLPLVRAAFAELEPLPPRRRRPRPAVVAAVGALLLAALAFTPPGQAVTGWFRDRIAHDRVRVEPRPALASLPAPGALLVDSPRGAWVVRRDGSKRLLGAYRDASWSPHGLFVAATRGDQLVAVTPTGQVRWSLTRARPRAPRWSPSGFRVAYLSGDRLRVVAGDGSGDRPLARAAAGVAPAWRRPGPAHVLAYAARDGGIRLVDVDRRRELWRSPAGPPPVALTWSADGRRLAAAGPGGVRVLDGSGLLVSRSRAPASAAAYAPFGRRLALVRRSPNGATSQLALVAGGRTRVLLASPGRLGRVAWSPDGRWLLVDWSSAGQWVFIPVGHPGRAYAAAGVTREFDPGARRPAGQPSPAEWCCAR